MIRYGPRVPRLHENDPRVIESRQFMIRYLAEADAIRRLIERRDHAKDRGIERSLQFWAAQHY